MELEYEFQTGKSTYDDNLGEEYFDTETYVYESSYKQIKNAVADIVYNRYFNKISSDNRKIEELKTQIKSFLLSLDDEIDFEDFFKEELHDFFESKARENFYNR